MKYEQKPAPQSVPEMLQALGDIYRERGKVYGHNYKNFGGVLGALFPDGLPVRTEDDWNRMGVFVHAITKLTRYANQWSTGGHDDSLNDAAVYFMMLRELDTEIRRQALPATDLPVDPLLNPEDFWAKAAGEIKPWRPEEPAPEAALRPQDFPEELGPLIFSDTSNLSRSTREVPGK